MRFGGDKIKSTCRKVLEHDTKHVFKGGNFFKVSLNPELKMLVFSEKLNSSLAMICDCNLLND